MKLNRASVQQQQSASAPVRSPDALFSAPVWAAKLLTVSAFLGVLAFVSLAVGVGIAQAVGNITPAALGIALAAFCVLPALIIRWLVMRSIGEVYSGAPVLTSTGPQQTVLVLERSLNVAGQRTGFGQDRVTINAPADEVARMLQWIKEHPDRTSRAQVTANVKVSQTTWQRVMTALEEIGAVEGGGKSGYTVTDTLDGMLDKLDARL